MKTIKIRFSELTHMANGVFINKAGQILASFEREASVLPSPPVSVDILRAEIDSLQAKNSIAESKNGSHNNRMERNIQRAKVYELLVLNGHYAAGLANFKTTYEEKKAFVELAGYPVAHASRSNVEKLRVTGLAAEVSSMPGNRTVKFKWHKGRCAAFIVQGTQDNPGQPSTEWNQLAVISQPKCDLVLSPGNWSIRIIGIYTDGNAEPGNVITFVLG